MHRCFMGIIIFLQFTGGFAPRRNKYCIRILEWDGFTDPNPNPWLMYKLQILG
jgi:hypothetical protein